MISHPTAVAMGDTTLWTLSMAEVALSAVVLKRAAASPNAPTMPAVPPMVKPPTVRLLGDVKISGRTAAAFAKPALLRSYDHPRSRARILDR